MAEAVRFDGITKRFPGVQALTDVSFAVAPGSCHALCGENGAGKSTLAKVLAGIHTIDAGRLFVHGQEVRFTSPRDALSAGIGMVHQELAFCDNLSVAENLCLGHIPSRRGFVSRSEMRQRARAMLHEIGATLDVTRRVGELTIAQQQLVQIAAAVGSGATILVFDEPTSSLSQQEVSRLYELIDHLRARGVTCIYVSHRMQEVFQLCDTVTVLRDGRHVETRTMAEVDEADLVQLMIGRRLEQYFPAHVHAQPAEEVLRVERLTVPGKFENVSFAVRAGEVVGFAGLIGAGRSEIACTLFGLDQATEGRILLNGREVSMGSPQDAIALGIGLVPEDRKRQGIVLSETCRHNVSLPILPRLAKATWVRTNEERALASEYFARLHVRTPSLDATIAGLSGGNQQKIVLAKWLAAKSRVLILDEPTRGVDVGAKAEIHSLIDKMAADGAAILLISSELPELLNLSRRILVLRAGRIVGEVSREEATQDGVLRLMAGLPAADVA